MVQSQVMHAPYILVPATGKGIAILLWASLGQGTQKKTTLPRLQFENKEYSGFVQRVGIVSE